MTAAVARLLFGFTIIAGLALLARGYADIGDGFSAGALAGLGAAMQFVALDYEHARRRVLARRAYDLLAGGLLLALVVVLAPLAFALPPVTHVPGPEGHVVSFGVLELHTATLFDLGVALAVYGAIAGTFDRLYPELEGDEP